MTKAQTTDAVQTLLVGEKQAFEMLGIRQTLFREMAASGRFGPMPIKLGRRKLWRKSDIEKWVQLGCPARQQFLELIGQEGGSRC